MPNDGINCGRNSAVECLVANENVVSSTLTARSRFRKGCMVKHKMLTKKGVAKEAKRWGNK